MSPPGKDSSYKRAEKGPIKPTYGLYLRASVPGRGCSGNKWHLWVIQHLRGSADARNNLLKGKQKGDHKVLKKDGPRGAQIKSLRAGLRGVRAEQPHRGTSGGFQQYPAAVAEAHEADYEPWDLQHSPPRACGPEAGEGHKVTGCRLPSACCRPSAAAPELLGMDLAPLLPIIWNCSRSLCLLLCAAVCKGRAKPPQLPGGW